MLAASAASLVPVCTCQVPLFAAQGEPAPEDYRLGKNKDLNGYFPMVVPKTKEEWAKRRQRVREQVLVANGLWPMPEKTPLKPVIHGKIEREGYTVEKVYFASMPGHYVSGNLYRPTGKPSSEKLPVVLCPHGHWNKGRLYENGDANIQKEIDRGAEKTKEGAKYPLQARCAMLAQMGFVVFFYDMVGYAESTAIKHVARSGVPAEDGFADAESELRLQSLMGLQTWNSIRSLDFVLGLPEVDPKRVGVTGASGGGTQTFLLAAIDDRVQASFPAVMVSTAMQGGCVCENCSLLRVGTGNIELAGLFAPKPMAMSGANDWTKEIMTKGLPELKELYKLLGAEQNVAAKAWVDQPHNYNQLAREFMYSWFSKHLLGKDESPAEKSFKPVPPKELEVYDDKHPRPKDELTAKDLRQKMTAASEAQFAKLEPKDAKSLEEFRKVLRGALRAMLVDELPEKIAIKKSPIEQKFEGGYTQHIAILGRTDEKDAIPVAGMFTEKFKDRVVVWVHPKGKASLVEEKKPTDAAKTLLDAGFAVLAPDVLGVGDLKLPKGYEVNKTYAGFTYGYNRSLLAHRVHDVLTAIAFAKTILKAKTIHLVGWEEFGPLAVLARAAAGEVVTKLAADLAQFRFESIKATDDPMMLPGALKYGGLPAFLALAAPSPTLVHNHKGTTTGKLTKAAFTAAGADYKRVNLQMKPEEVVEWLVKS
jgi:dienelactone hydrolase